MYLGTINASGLSMHRDYRCIGTINASGLSPLMTRRDGHGYPQAPTTTTQFSPPRVTSYTNGVNGNNPGIVAQDGDSVRLNAAPNGSIASKVD
jgi:hypothetical protein